MNVKILIFTGMLLLFGFNGAAPRMSRLARNDVVESSLKVELLHHALHHHWNANQTPTPHPTPLYDPTTFIPPATRGKTVIVRGPNLADKIQAAQDDPAAAMVKIEGGGSISQ